jgi:peptidoglycan/xylan/chitin deacetylase (PgdA/CDA1 family)
VNAARLRWAVKKAGRRGMALVASGRRLLAPRGEPCVRVVTYHRIAAATRDPFSVAPDDFAHHMAWLAETGSAIGLDELTRFLAGDGPPPATCAVLVTIDDGLASLRSRALPILAHHRIPAVAFVSAGRLGDVADDDGGSPERHLTWSELRDVTDAGVTIGSHAWSHRSLASLPIAVARDDVRRARDVLEQRTGRAVTAFAYPFGTRADFSPALARVLAECGHTLAFTSQHGAIRPGIDPFTLPRVKIEGGEPVWMFPLLCRGALDAWRWVDRALWRLQEREA